MDYVLAPEQITWKALDSPAAPSAGFSFTPSIIGADYTGQYSAQLCRIKPDGRSEPHIDDYNHAFYVISGTGTVTVEKQSWPISPGAIVKIPSGPTHSLANTGRDDLVFLVIYDPPHVSGGPFDHTLD